MEAEATTVETTQEAPAQVEQPSSQPLVDAAGNFREGWTDNEALARKFTSVDSLVKSYTNLESMLGKEKMPVPGMDSPQEVWDEVYGKLGRPESPEQYELDKPEDLPPDFPWDDNNVAEFKTLAHKLGLSQEQARQLVQFDIQRMTTALESNKMAMDGAMEQNFTALEQAWGRDYEKNLDLAKAADSVMGLNIAEDQVLGNNPKVLQLLAKVGGMINEGRLKAGRAMVTPSIDVDAEIQQMYDVNSGHPYARAYTNPQHPDHQRAVKHMQTLFARKYPDGDD